jgi:hypothetical protein
MTISSPHPQTGIYLPWVDNESLRPKCLSRSYLNTDPYLTSHIDKQTFERDNSKCTVLDEKRTTTSASWRMVCEHAVSGKANYLIQNTASTDRFLSVKEGGSDIARVRIEVKAVRVGDCTPKMWDPQFDRPVNPVPPIAPDYER